MRTTVRLDDDLYRTIKESAARQGRTVASVMEEAIRLGLEAIAPADTGPTRLPAVDGPIDTHLGELSYGNALGLLDEDRPADHQTAV